MRVVVLDYGIGNLLSVRRAFEHCGAEIELADSAAKVEAAERLVLPGVGAFADGMRGLRERGLDSAVVQFAASGRPLLGICLGMQLLLSQSEEFGTHEGLGIIPGRVTAIPRIGSNGEAHKIPHIGWTKLVPSTVTHWRGTILQDVQPESSVYMVHSFTAVPDSPEHRLADCYYDGCLIAAAIRSGAVYGCQFHPEKSATIGLGILRRFIASG